jgi:hypothetical protein
VSKDHTRSDFQSRSHSHTLASVKKETERPGKKHFGQNDTNLVTIYQLFLYKSPAPVNKCNALSMTIFPVGGKDSEANNIPKQKRKYTFIRQILTSSHGLGCVGHVRKAMVSASLLYSKGQAYITKKQK